MAGNKQHNIKQVVDRGAFLHKLTSKMTTTWKSDKNRTNRAPAMLLHFNALMLYPTAYPAAHTAYIF